MRKILASAGLIGLILAGGDPAAACGDKFANVGRGRYHRGYVAVHSASILIYMPSSSAMPAAVKQLKLTAALRRAGHRFETAADAASLDKALRSTPFDIVLADYSDADTLETHVRAARSKPTVVPVVNRTAQTHADRAQRKYHCVLKTPNTTNYALALIDHEMEARIKAAQVERRTS